MTLQNNFPQPFGMALERLLLRSVNLSTHHETISVEVANIMTEAIGFALSLEQKKNSVFMLGIILSPPHFSDNPSMLSAAMISSFYLESLCSFNQGVNVDFQRKGGTDNEDPLYEIYLFPSWKRQRIFTGNPIEQNIAFDDVIECGGVIKKTAENLFSQNDTLSATLCPLHCHYGSIFAITNQSNLSLTAFLSAVSSWFSIILQRNYERRKRREIQSIVQEVIDILPQGFIVFDDKDRLVVCNSTYRQLYQEIAPNLVAGAHVADLANLWASSAGRQERISAENLIKLHHRGHWQHTAKRHNGKYFKVQQKSTSKNYRVWLHTDVSEMKERQQELEIMGQKLKENNQALAASNGELEHFAYAASHDLQEPLRKIEAFGERLKESLNQKNNQLDEETAHCLERILNAGGRMRKLIMELLDYSRLSTGQSTMRDIDLNDVIERAKSDLEIALEEKNGHIQSTHLPVIYGDMGQLCRLFQNLFSNSLKFLAPDRTPIIQISYEKQENKWHHISIRDNGIGFEKKYEDAIFKLFQRLHARTQYEGTGIGLASCKKIVERHGGTMNAKGYPQKGAEFIIRFPIKTNIHQKDNTEKTHTNNGAAQ